MTTMIARSNFRYNKGRNLLIGIAISLATLLLLIVPSIGYNAILLQNAAVNETYPTWHTTLKGIKADTLQELKLCSGLDKIGVRYDAAKIVQEGSSIDLYYLDQDSLSMNRMALEAGKLPKKEDEIVLSNEILQIMGQKAGIGDRIRIPYQLRTKDGLDYAVSKEFTICGLLSKSDVQTEEKSYIGLVSDAFLQTNIRKQDLEYLAYIQISGADKQWMTDDIESKIYEIADDFDIDREKIGINEDYLRANYTDPSLVMGLAVILLIIVIAGVITIYSIYYISMVQNIQEYGKLKAIGATSKQIRQIVLKEGMLTAAIAIPAGLLIGSLGIKVILHQILEVTLTSNTNEISIMKELLDLHKVTLYHWQIYMIAALLSTITVFLSLRKPMKIAGRLPVVEAIRHHGDSRSKNRFFKGYDSMNVWRLAMRNLTDHKKRTVMTILAMSATGILYMTVASVLSSTSPEQSANDRMPGEYEIAIYDEENNKEHPEYTWNEIQKSNPLTDNLKNQIQNIDGVEEVDVFSRGAFTCDQFEGNRSLLGLPEKYWNEVEKTIIKGKAEYSDLQSGDKVILNSLMLYWYPDLKVGDRLTIHIADGDRILEKTIEIIAIADVRNAIAQYEFFILSDTALTAWYENNQNYYFHIQAREKQNAVLEKQLKEAIGTDKRMQLATWEDEYQDWKRILFLFNIMCYAFLGILGAISIMNLINTMLNSIHARKKELGIMQAIGLSAKQFTAMLQMESIIYTAGTLLTSLGIGTLLGYAAFRYAKNEHLLNISVYQFPLTQTLLLIFIVVTVQFIISITTAKFSKKETLIDRIRLNE